MLQSGCRMFAKLIYDDKGQKMVTSGLEGSYWPEGGMRQPSEIMGRSRILGGDNTCVYKRENSSHSTLQICACYYM